MKSLSLLILSLLLIPGCSMYVRPVKAIPESPSENNVTILRNYNYVGGAMRYFPTIDGAEVAGLFPHQHVSVTLSPGPHKIGVRCGFGDDELEVTIKDNAKYYYKISPNLWSFVNPSVCGEIEEIGQPDAIERLQASTRISTGHLSDCDRRSVLYESNPDYTCFSFAFPR
jgi:hypothetical protein